MAVTGGWLVAVQSGTAPNAAMFDTDGPERRRHLLRAELHRNTRAEIKAAASIIYTPQW